MKPSDFQNAIRLQFDFLVKRVIDTTIKDYSRETFRRVQHEVEFTDLPKNVLEQLYTVDNHDFLESICFEVMGMQIKVFNEQLGNALKNLHKKQRDIILMFYFLEMPESEISNHLCISRRTFFRYKKKALEDLKKHLTGEMKNETDM